MKYTQITIVGSDTFSWVKSKNLVTKLNLESFYPTNNCEHYFLKNKNTPVLVVEYNPKENEIRQIRYKNNEVIPIECIKPLNLFIKKLAPKNIYHGGFNYCGIIYQNKKIYSLTDLPSGFVVNDSVNLARSQDFDISDDIVINGSLILSDSQIKKLPNITIKDTLDLRHTNIELHEGIKAKFIYTDWGELSNCTLKNAVAVTLYCIDKYGFTPVNKGYPTYIRVLEYLRKNTKADKKYNNVAEKILEWFKTLKKTNDFLINLLSIVRYTYVPFEGLPFIVGAVHSFMSKDKHVTKDKLTKVAEKPVTKKTKSEYIGKIGERHDFGIITVTKVGKYYDKYDDSDYEFCAFIDKDNNVIRWFSKRLYCGVNEHDKVHCIANIKSHKEFNGVKQTLITYPKFKKE